MFGRQRKRGWVDTCPCANGIGVLLLSMHTSRNRISGEGESGYNDLQACQT